MVKKVFRASDGRIVQFRHIDGINGPETTALGLSLGLEKPQYGPHWGAKLPDDRWHAVHDGDYVLVQLVQIV
jgi:hypothetical protein